MGPKPVRRVKVPAYPTRGQILANPSLLEKHVPEAWRLSSEITRAAALFLIASIPGCNQEPIQDIKAPTHHFQEPSRRCNKENPSPVAAAQPAPRGRDSNKEPLKPRSSIVAPLFNHGNGRGSTGCIVVSPPVFLSEEEAMNVITDQLEKSGYSLSERNVPWNGVTIPSRREKWLLGNGNMDIDIVVDPDKNTPLNVDGYDPKRRIGVEFVSERDFFDLGGPRSDSTVQRYNFKETAEWMNKQVKEKGEKGIYFGAFYDPMSYKDPPNLDKEKDWEARWKKLEECRKKESLRLLRRQVKDFVDWLKAHGAF